MLKQTLRELPDLAERLLARLDHDPFLKEACEDFESIARRASAAAQRPDEVAELNEILGEIESEIRRRLSENNDN